MKAKRYLKFRLVLLLSLISVAQLFAGTQVNKVFANRNFKISQQQDVITLDISKNPWESFTLSVNSLDIQRNPVVNLEIKSNEPIELRVDLTDGIFMSSTYEIVKKEITGVKNFTPVAFDFTEMIDDIDLTGDVYLLFYVNPGCKFKGEIAIRNFSLDDRVLNTNHESAHIAGFSMFPSPASTYTMVEIPDEKFQSLAITDMNGREVLHEDISFDNGTSYRVNLQGLPSGYYTVRLTGVNNQITEKLIIN